MKRTLLAIALSVAAVGYASAQDYDDQVLAPVIVEHVDIDRLVENCTPPAAAPECAGFHAMIRQNFSGREIGMLFGAATAYPEYLTSYSAVRERYDAMLRYIEDHGLPVVAVDQPVTIVSPPAATPAYEDEPVRYEARYDRVRVPDDDPDAVILSRQTIRDDDDEDEVPYYDDELPPPRRDE
ncbi:MAG TPA: hypothetical protein VLB69_08895 [Rudaea sp.]|nr:hypothetical protein [Rudaea sp.]